MVLAKATMIAHPPSDMGLSALLAVARRARPGVQRNSVVLGCVVNVAGSSPRICRVLVAGPFLVMMILQQQAHTSASLVVFAV